MGRPLWFVELIKRAFPGRFILARVTNIKPFGRLVKRWLFEGDELAYLPINLSVEVGETPAMGGDYVVPDAILDHFIQEAGQLWIMDECICRSASGCISYPVELGCLFMGEATQHINPELGRPVSKQEARAHLRHARHEGLVHLIGRNKLDTIWLGAGPGNKLLTVCNCCPCCCLWRMHPQLSPGIRSALHRLPGLRVIVTEACSACELCLDEVCFVSAIEVKSGKAFIGEACLGCGRCVDLCPEGAITFLLEEMDFIQSAIDRITPLVDVRSQ